MNGELSVLWGISADVRDFDLVKKDPGWLVRLSSRVSDPSQGFIQSIPSH